MYYKFWRNSFCTERHRLIGNMISRLRSLNDGNLDLIVENTEAVENWAGLENIPGALIGSSRPKLLPGDPASGGWLG